MVFIRDRKMYRGSAGQRRRETCQPSVVGCRDQPEPSYRPCSRTGGGIKRMDRTDPVAMSTCACVTFPQSRFISSLPPPGRLAWEIERIALGDPAQAAVTEHLLLANACTDFLNPSPLKRPIPSSAAFSGRAPSNEPRSLKFPFSTFRKILALVVDPLSSGHFRVNCVGDKV
jgi:hypothetical protein